MSAKFPDRGRILVASTLSWFGATGGLAIGFLLGLIGGILDIVWQPKIVPQNLEPRTCPQCNRVQKMESKFCQYF
jgi:hypothetical protein